MKNDIRRLSAAALLGLLIMTQAQAQVTILTPLRATPQETLATREVLRYVYLRTGRLLSITAGNTAPGKSLLVARKDHSLASGLVRDRATRDAIAGLKPEQYLLRTMSSSGGTKLVLLVGGDNTGTLYAAYRFAEHLGVRFYLSGDTIPDGKIALSLPNLNEIGRPLFSIRGIQPFHDFPEGPDWWDRDDYLAYVAQLAKMRMNFLGIHTYPEGGPNAEPAVWMASRRTSAPAGR